MAKFGAGMIACGDNLALFGGYGVPRGPTQPGSSFIKHAKSVDGGGCTNEVHIYHTKEGMRFMNGSFFYIHAHPLLLCL